MNCFRVSRVSTKRGFDNRRDYLVNGVKSLKSWCLGRESNSYVPFGTQDFKSSTLFNKFSQKRLKNRSYQELRVF